MLSYSRIDFLCGYLGLIDIALVLVNCLMLAIFLSFAICQLLIYMDKELNYILKVFTSKSITMASTILFLPLVTLLIIDIKYFFTNNIIIEEYLSANTTYNNSLSLFRSGGSLIVLLLANFIYDNFAFEIRHITKDKCIDAQATGYVNRIVKILHLSIALLYAFIYNIHPLLFQIIYFCLSVYIIGFYLHDFPYYSNYMNKVKIICTSIECISSLCFIVGTIINNSGVILLLSTIITPCGCLLMS